MDQLGKYADLFILNPDLKIETCEQQFQPALLSLLPLASEQSHRKNLWNPSQKHWNIRGAWRNLPQTQSSGGSQNDSQLPGGDMSPSGPTASSLLERLCSSERLSELEQEQRRHMDEAAGGPRGPISSDRAAEEKTERFIRQSQPDAGADL